MHYCTDAAGQEMLVLDDGLEPHFGTNKVVMMEWEQPYMEACVDALNISPQDRVLEIGFGCAFSANRIQTYRPKCHTIIECAPVVLVKLRAWAAAKQPCVEIVEGIWQEQLAGLGTFDCIFFDDFPLPGVAPEPTALATGSRWHGFVDQCLDRHMSPGSRITGYMARPLEFTRRDGYMCHL